MINNNRFASNIIGQRIQLVAGQIDIDKLTNQNNRMNTMMWGNSDINNKQMKQKQVQHQAMSTNQLQLRRQHNKRQKLHSQLSSIRQHILTLKHTYFQLGHLIHTLLLQTDLQPTTQLIQSKITQLLQQIPQMKSLKSLLGKELETKVEMMPEVMELECEGLVGMAEELVMCGREGEVEGKVMMWYGWLGEVNGKIEEIRQSLHKRQRQIDINDKLQPFLQLIQNKYHSLITPQQFKLLQNLNFTQFTLSLTTQLTTIRSSITDLKSTITQSRDRYIQIDANVKDIGDTEAELNRLLNQQEQMRKELAELERYNNELEANMEGIVHKRVVDRMDVIDIENCQQANRYLLAGQYILEKFGAILDKAELAELQAEVGNLAQAVHQKIAPTQ